MRWGEPAGLRRANIHLGQPDPGNPTAPAVPTGPATHPHIDIHPQTGALHEVDGKLFLGPPKTRDAARRVALPAVRAGLLRELLDSHHHDTVFCGTRGGYQRRSNFNRRAWRPAVDANPTRGLPAIEDGIPEIAQARRLGHRLPGVRGIYSHATPTMEQAITDTPHRR